MHFQRVDRTEIAGQFGFTQAGVNLVVANLVKQHGFPTLSAAQFGYEMVLALLGVRRNGPVAKWADRNVIHAGEMG